MPKAEQPQTPNTGSEYETLLPDIKLTDKQVENVKAHFSKRFTVMKSYRDQLDPLVQEWIDLYNSKKEVRPYPWQSNVNVPYIFTMIKAILPRITAILLTSPEFVKMEATSEKLLHFEQHISGWFNAKLRQMKFKKKAREAIHASFKYPMGIIKLRWVFQIVRAEIRKFLGLIPIKGTQIEMIDDPNLEVVNFFDFWWDPAASSMDTARDVIHRVVRDYSYLKRQEKRGFFKNVDKVQFSSSVDESAQKKAAVDIYGFKMDNMSYSDGYKPVELHEYWGAVDLNGDSSDVRELIITMGNQTTPLRISENPFYNQAKLFYIIKPMLEDNQFTGMPYIKLLDSPQRELNTVRRQRVDNRNLQLGKIFKANKYGDIDEEQIFAGPGNVMWLEDMEDVQEFKVENVFINAEAEEANIKQDMQQLGSTTDSLMGVSARGRQTATEVSINTSEATTGISDLAENVADQFVDLFEGILYMFKQFKDDDPMYRVMYKNNPVFTKIPLRSLHGKYLFTYNFKKLSTPTVQKMGVYTNLLNIVGKYPFINVPALVRSTLEAFEIKNIEEIMDMEKFAAEMKAQLAKQLAAKSAEQGAPLSAEQTIEAGGGTLGAPANGQLPQQPVQGLAGAQAVGETKTETGIVG